MTTMIAILESSPWWDNKGIDHDPDLVLTNKSLLQYNPQPFTAHDLTAGRIYTLRGARRVGKTVALKLFVKELIKDYGMHARSIVWWNADTSRRVDILESELKALCEYTKKESKQNNTKYPKLLIVDEITSVPKWQKAIKKLKDQGYLQDMCLVLTGSSAHDLKAGTETMAGRRGISSNLDRVLFNMSYKTFYECSNNTASIFDYIKVGGFPFRVEEFLKKGQEFDVSYGSNILEEIFMYEVIRRGLDRSIAFEIITRIASLAVTAISYEGFAQQLSINKDTARKHLDAYGDAFLLATYSSLDLRTFRAAPKKNRKFLWFDPAFRCLAHSLRRGPIIDDAAVVESIVGAELIRRYEMFAYHGYSVLDSVFTWKSSNNHEIDFVAAIRHAQGHRDLLPIEVKFQNSISEWDWQVLKKSFASGVLVTKDSDLETNDSKIKVVGLERFLLQGQQA